MLKILIGNQPQPQILRDASKEPLNTHTIS